MTYEKFEELAKFLIAHEAMGNNHDSGYHNVVIPEEVEILVRNKDALSLVAVSKSHNRYYYEAEYDPPDNEIKITVFDVYYTKNYLLPGKDDENDQ